MRENSKVDELTFALSADVTEAHRQVSIHPDDWHYLGCQVILGGDAFINTVGTFSIASAYYYCSRAGAIGVYYNISLVILQLHGICLSRTTVYWNPGALGIVLDSYSSLCCVLWLAFRYPGIKLAVKTRLSGSASRFSRGRDLLVFRQDAPSGSYDGLRKLLSHRRYKWRLSRRGWVVSCS